MSARSNCEPKLPDLPLVRLARGLHLVISVLVTSSFFLLVVMPLVTSSNALCY